MKMNLHRLLCLLIFFALSQAQSSEALQIPPQPSTWIVDYASVLSPQTESELNQRLKKFEEETSNQVVAAIFPSLEDESLEDYANRLFEKWAIGQKKNNNGVLLIVFVNDRKVRIEVGYGLEGVLTDAVSSRIIRNEILPEFRNGNYDAGIRKGLAAIESATRGEYKGAPASAQKDRIDPALIFFAIVIGFLILRTIFRFRRNSGVFIPDPRFRGRRNRNPYNDWWIGGFPGGGSGGGWGGGGGGGGGFSGGGGMSGGGGASGSW